MVNLFASYTFLSKFVGEFGNFMELNNIQEELRRLTTLLEEWDQSQPLPEIERDLILEKLRSIYEAIRINKPTLVAPQSIIEAAKEIEEETIAIPVGFGLGDLLISEPLPETEPEFVPTLSETESEPTLEETAALGTEEPAEIVLTPTLADEVPVIAEQTPVAELSQEPTPAPEQTFDQEITIATSAPEEKPTPIEPSTPQRPMTATLFGEEEVVRHRHKQRVIMSLYDNDTTTQTQKTALAAKQESVETSSTTTEVTIEPSPEITTSEETPTTSTITETPDEEFVIEEISLEELAPEYTTTEEEETIGVSSATESPVPILGEVINPNVQTLADTLAAPHDIASELRNRPVEDLESAIGINDKFLLIRDLFEGDSTAYTETIRTLNSFDDFDECMIHIALNYSWNPNSDGAKLLTELLERKLL